MSIVNKNTFDLCILGCGSGGFAAAMRALDLGKHVCVLESDQIGGAGVRWGALASKTLWELAKDYAVASKKDRGYRATGLRVDFEAVKSTVYQAISERQNQMRLQIEAFSPDNHNGPGSLTFKSGTGSFISPNEVMVTDTNGRRETIAAAYFIIATGSSPRRIPGIDVDQEQILDSDGIMQLKKFPKRLLIIGAGISGCEYATIFSNFGQTKVYLVDHMERIIPYEDDDISRFVSTNLMDKGVSIYHSARLKDIARASDAMTATLEFPDGRLKKIRVDALLLSIGRKPNLADLNLGNLSISIGKSGDLESDSNCCVNNNIYAAGDVTAHPDLVNIAEMEGRYAVKHMFGIKQRPLNYRNMSTVMFFYPAVGAVGLNEKSCQQKQIPYRVAYYANALLPRAIAMRALNGFVKIIVNSRDDQRILGMRAGGPQVSNTIMSITFLMDLKQNIDHVLRSVHPHPTMSEGIQECLRLLRGESVYKPQTFPQLIKIRTWHPGDGVGMIGF
jgi:dihydrolipoamide dehydrogenase